MPEIVLHRGMSALAVADVLAELYRSAFCHPPWNETESMVDGFLARLSEDVARPGFAAALAHRGEGPVGFGTAWRTKAPFPIDRRYGDVLSALGVGRATRWLAGAQEIGELAVAPHARRLGVGSRLLKTLTGLEEDRGSWLVTFTRSPVTVPFYRRCGWHQVTDPRGDGNAVVVFLSPRHPGASASQGRPGVHEVDR